jgi:hypothetical protein
MQNDEKNLSFRIFRVFRGLFLERENLDTKAQRAPSFTKKKVFFLLFFSSSLLLFLFSSPLLPFSVFVRGTGFCFEF